MRKKSKALVMLLLLVVVLSGFVVLNHLALAYDSAIATYTWNASTPNYNPAATIHPGTIDLTNLVMGDFLGVSAGQPNAPGYGDSGGSVGWDDAWTGGGHPNTNGDALDGLWAQIIYPREGWWDLGFETDQVVVFLSQDHGPYLAEGLETRVYGSNTLWGAVSSLAVLTEVYLDGWRPHNSAEDGNGNGWCSDDIAGVYRLPRNYRYIKIAAWSSGGGLNEPEVDALAAIREIPVYVDIKPGSWPNPINKQSRGEFAVAICGTDEFDVTTIDPETIMLTIEGLEVGVPPLRWSYEDVATPYDGEPGGGHDLEGDGYLDLVLHFQTWEVVTTLHLCEYEDGEVVSLVIIGNLKLEYDGTKIHGQDYVRIIQPRVSKWKFKPA